MLEKSQTEEKLTNINSIGTYNNQYCLLRFFFKLKYLKHLGEPNSPNVTNVEQKTNQRQKKVHKEKEKLPTSSLRTSASIDVCKILTT